MCVPAPPPRLWQPAGVSDPALLRRAAALCCAAPVLSAAALGWLADDAFISLRVVENTVAGLGLRWNAAERVQVFSHPLWLLALLPLRLLLGGGPAAALALSLLCTAASGALIWRSLGPRGAPLALALALCKATADHASGGLENPLLGLLLLGFGLELTGAARAPALGFWLGATLLTRPDQLGLLLPGFGWALARAGRGRSAALALAVGPIMAWMAWSTLYFGSPLPNPSLAKLGAGVPADRLALQGLAYLKSLLVGDPGAAALLFGGIGAGLGAAGPRRALAAGALLQIGVVVAEGGDFMAGRLWTSTITLGALLLALDRRRAAQIGLLLVIMLCVAHPRGPLRGGPRLDHRALDPAGVADERGFWAQTTGWWPRIADGRPWPRPATGAERRVLRMHNVGLDAYLEGPTAHVIDQFALTEPLLARLPCGCGDAFRPGHLERAVPAGWEERLRGAPGPQLDPELAALAADLELLHRAPLLAPGRGAAVLRVLAADLGLSPPGRRP